MSDFDKEAEREKLREKYERDQQERQATQRMSDLLLKGATMTNAHCGTCGDPLFQQNDTTFCPSCHGNPDAVEGTDLEAQPAEESPDSGTAVQSPDGESTQGSASDAGGAGSEQAASRDKRSRSTREPDQPATGDASADAADAAADSSAPSRDSRSPSAQSESPPSASGVDAPRGSSSDGPSAPSRQPSAARPAGDLEAAHASLVQALEKFAAKAADTDDPRYAKECLEAAREASETLETLR